MTLKEIIQNEMAIEFDTNKELKKFIAENDITPSNTQELLGVSPRNKIIKFKYFGYTTYTGSFWCKNIIHHSKITS